jgi:hypothetical protein
MRVKLLKVTWEADSKPYCEERIVEVKEE